MTKERKEQLIKEYGRNGQDTGSVEVQLALLTERINELTEHLKTYLEVTTKLGIRKK